MPSHGSPKWNSCTKKVVTSLMSIVLLGTGSSDGDDIKGLCYLLAQAATLTCGSAVLIVCDFRLGLQSVGLYGQNHPCKGRPSPFGRAAIGFWVRRYLGVGQYPFCTVSLKAVPLLPLVKE